MSSWTNDGGSPDDGALLRAVELASQKFDAAWNQESPPRLEEFLAEFTGDGRDHALCDLLWIEWERRRQRGETPELADYLSRFDGEEAVVEAAWRSDFRRLALESRENQMRGGRYRIVQPHARGGLGQVYVAHDDELGRSVAIKEIQWRFAKKRGVQQRFIREARITGCLEHPGIVPVYSVGEKPDGTPFYAMRFVDGESLKEAIDRVHGRVLDAPSEPSSGPRSSPEASQVDPSIPEVARRGTSAPPNSAVAGNAPSKSLPEPSTDGDNTDGNSTDGNNTAANEGSVEPEARQDSEAPANPRPRRPARALVERDYSSLEFRQLLARFAYVCRVMAYAHGRGVIHRDLKPANIMLGPYGETLVVDWGLAKELGTADPCDRVEPFPGNLTRLEFTTHGARVGTVAYMSPEQAAGDVERLTPACDIYSLGATLFHLLTGDPPLLGALGELALERISAGRIPSAKTMQPAVPAPLDAICSRALARNPSDRYPTASALADDVEHWLADEPVAAHREPLLARGARWVRRHQTLMATSTVATVLVAILCGAIASLTIARNRDLATANATTAREAFAANVARRQAHDAQLVAESERDQAEQLAKFMLTTFRSPELTYDASDLRVSEILDRAFEELKSNQALTLDTKLRLYESLADAYLSLELAGRAIAICEHATFEARASSEAVRFPISLKASLAHAHCANGNSVKGASIYEEVFKESTELLGPHDGSTVRRGAALARAYRDCNRLQDSLTLLTSLKSIAQDRLPPNDDARFSVERELSYTLSQFGHHEQSISLAIALVTRLEQHYGKNAPLTLLAVELLAACYQSAAQLSDAARTQQLAVERRLAVSGEISYQALAAQLSLGHILISAKQFDSANTVYSKVHELASEHFGTSSSIAMSAADAIHDSLVRSGQFQNAVTNAEGMTTKRRKLLGPAHPATISSESRLIRSLLQAGRITEAVKRADSLEIDINSPQILVSRQVFDLQMTVSAAYAAMHLTDRSLEPMKRLITAREKAIGTDHPLVIRGYHSLATLMLSSAMVPESLRILEDIEPKAIRVLGGTHVDTLAIMARRAQCLRRLGNSTEAIKVHRNVYRETVLAFGPQHYKSYLHEQMLGSSLVTNGEFNEGMSHYRSALDGLITILGSQHRDVIALKMNIGCAMYLAGDQKGAIDILEPLRSIIVPTFGASDIQVANYFAVLGMSHCELGDIERGLDICRKALVGDFSSLPAGHPNVWRLEEHLATELLRYDRSQEAIGVLDSSFTRVKSANDVSRDLILSRARSIAKVLQDGKQWSEASRYHQQCLLAIVDLGPKAVEEKAAHLHLLATCEMQQGACDNAEDVARTCLGIREKGQNGLVEVNEARILLAEILVLQGNLEEAEALLISADAEMASEADMTITPRVEVLRKRASDCRLRLLTEWGRLGDAPGMN